MKYIGLQYYYFRCTEGAHPKVRWARSVNTNLETEDLNNKITVQDLQIDNNINKKDGVRHSQGEIQRDSVATKVQNWRKDAKNINFADLKNIKQTDVSSKSALGHKTLFFKRLLTPVTL